MQEHNQYMKRCIQLALLGNGNVLSNPMVGSVLVYKNRILGEGYHTEYGAPHAEIACLNAVKEDDKKYISKATLYVNLEPCSHTGKTPPCANRIVKEKIKKVIIGSIDPNPLVAGNGIKILQENSIEVEVGILEKECIELNIRFYTFHLKHRPFIKLKWAQSVDGFISEHNKQTKLSNKLSDIKVHQMRANEMAIWAGYRTLLCDNPLLNVRHILGNNPIIITLDKYLDLPTYLHIFDNDTKKIIFNFLKNEKLKNTHYIKVNEKNHLEEMLQHLYKLNINSILVEGGKSTLEMFIYNNKWDYANIIECKKIIHNGVEAPKIGKAINENFLQIENDIWHFYKNKETCNF